MSVLGGKISAARKDSGLSLAALAAACGVSKTHIWELEKGRASNPSINTLCDLADGLSLSLNTLAYAARDDYRDGTCATPNHGGGG